MSNVWKIIPWLVSSTNRTAPPIEILGLRITYTDGVIAVNNNDQNPIVLLISYFDNEGRERAFLRDNISAAVIAQKGLEMGMSGQTLQDFVNDTMNTIIVHALGGTTKEERYTTIAALAQMYGQTLLPIEEQTGFIVEPQTEPQNEQPASPTE